MKSRSRKARKSKEKETQNEDHKSLLKPNQIAEKRPNRLSARNSTSSVNKSLQKTSDWLEKLSKRISDTESQIELNKSINVSVISKSGRKSFAQLSAKQSLVPETDQQVVILHCGSWAGFKNGVNLFSKLMKADEDTSRYKISSVSLKGKSKREEIYLISQKEQIDVSKDPVHYQKNLIWKKEGNEKINKSNVEKVFKEVKEKLV